MLASIKGYLIGGLVLAVGLGGLWLGWQLDRANDRADRAEQQARGLQARAESAESAIVTSERLRLEEATLARTIKEELDALKIRNAQLDLVADRLPGLDRRLRDAETSALACGRRRATEDAAAAAAVRAADEAIELHARLLERLGVEEAEAAGFAERSAAASAGCTASYRREQQRSEAFEAMSGAAP